MFWILIENDLYVVEEKPMSFDKVIIKVDNKVIQMTEPILNLTKKYRTS